MPALQKARMILDAALARTTHHDHNIMEPPESAD